MTIFLPMTIATCVLVWWWYHPDPPGRVVLTCTACGSHLHENLPKWPARIQLFSWLVFAGVFLGPLFDAGVIGWIFAILIIIPWRVAAERLYRAWWTRKHPARCQPEGTNT